MNKIIFVIVCLSLSLYPNDLSMEQIQAMIKKIHKKREGIKLETLETTAEPFVRREKAENNVTTFVLPKSNNDEAQLSLHAIVNKKAYINNAWRSVDEKVETYILKYIGKRGVVLRNRDHIKKLFLHDKRKNFISLEER